MPTTVRHRPTQEWDVGAQPGPKRDALGPDEMGDILRRRSSRRAPSRRSSRDRGRRADGLPPGASGASTSLRCKNLR